MQRFFDKVYIINGGCWHWIASLRGKSGYGAFKLDGKVVDAHRVSWIIHKGDIPDGMLICHTCDNRTCVNPDHLFLGTHEDNSKDAYNKGRVVLPSGVVFEKGHQPANRALTDNQAIELKEAIARRGRKPLRLLAKEMGLKYQLVKDVKNQRSYKEIRAVVPSIAGPLE